MALPFPHFPLHPPSHSHPALPSPSLPYLHLNCLPLPSSNLIQTHPLILTSTNPVADKIPTGEPINEIGEYSPYGYTVIFTETASDCCRVCQEFPNANITSPAPDNQGGCFGGSWDEGGPYPGRCFLFTLEPGYPDPSANETCAPRNSYGLFSRDEYVAEDYTSVAL